MAKDSNGSATSVQETRDQLVAVMTELKIASPARMLARIEKMLPDRERDQMLRMLLADFQQPNKEEVKRIIRTLAPDRDEWDREVERLIQNYRPA